MKFRPQPEKFRRICSALAEIRQRAQGLALFDAVMR